MCVCVHVHTTQIQYSISTHHGIAVGFTELQLIESVRKPMAKFGK